MHTNLSFKPSLVNCYLAYKQHLLPSTHLTDITQVTHNIIALHATDPTSPYLSLWARVPDFQHQKLERALYEQRELVKALCMRVTLHIVPSDELPFFFQAFPQAFFERHTPAEFRGKGLLVQAGVCQEAEAEAMLENLHCRVLNMLAEKGPATARQINQAIPEFRAKIRHDVGKPYEGEFSLGSRLVPGMCTRGLLVRTRPQGTWRSSLYEYAALSDWLPDIDLESVTPQEAQTWLMHRYLAAFGPATLDDVQWWTGFSKGETKKALGNLSPAIVPLSIEGLNGQYLMLPNDVQWLRDFEPPDIPYSFLLPALDPYIMGYQDRRRFLAPEHYTKVFDRAGNAVSTVWVNGRIAGVWSQRKDGSVTYGPFESLDEQEHTLLANEAQRLENFLSGEYLPPRFHTPVTHSGINQ